MVSLSARPEVVVIGAGAAGIAAGRALARRKIPFLIVEARTRVGGRAVTQEIAGGHRVDLGCEWLHSADRNVLAQLAEASGVGLDKSMPPWGKRHEQVGFDQATQDDFATASDAFFERLEVAGQNGCEGPASALLEPGNRWNGLLEAISTYYNGAPLEHVSVVDFHRYVDTEVNWRVAGGLGAFITRLADGLPIRTGCRVLSIDLAGREIRIDTDAGPIQAPKVIVTLPTSVLASDAIRLDPRLDAYREAAAGLPLGVADKVFLALDAPEDFVADRRLLGGIDRIDCGSYTIRAHGRPVVEGYFGGDLARELEKGGLAAFASVARREIDAALGRDIGSRLTPILATAWAQDPFAMGSYSHALPGCAESRAALAVPFEDRLVFAGEATSRAFFSTAHGAWEEGEAAVTRLLGSTVSDPVREPA